MHSLLTLSEDYIKEYFSETFHKEVREIIEKVIGLEDLPTPICIACETNILFYVFFFVFTSIRSLIRFYSSKTVSVRTCTWTIGA